MAAGTAAITEPASTAIFTCRIVSGSPSNASCPISNETVNPMPASRECRTTSPHAELFVQFGAGEPRGDVCAAEDPTVFPTTRPSTTPSGTGSVNTS